MSGFKTIEDIKVWDESIKLVTEIYLITNQNKIFMYDYALKEQIRKSSISIPSNIAEGYERGSKREFIRFLYIAKGSCGELRTQLKISRELEYIKQDKYIDLEDLCKKISAMCMKLIQKLKL